MRQQVKSEDSRLKTQESRLQTRRSSQETTLYRGRESSHDHIHSDLMSKSPNGIDTDNGIKVYCSISQHCAPRFPASCIASIAIPYVNKSVCNWSRAFTPSESKRGGKNTRQAHVGHPTATMVRDLEYLSIMWLFRVFSTITPITPKALDRISYG